MLIATEFCNSVSDSDNYMVNLFWKHFLGNSHSSYMKERSRSCIRDDLRRECKLGIYDQHDWMTGVTYNGNERREYRIVPHALRRCPSTVLSTVPSCENVRFQWKATSLLLKALLRGIFKVRVQFGGVPSTVGEVAPSMVLLPSLSSKTTHGKHRTNSTRILSSYF